MKVLDVGAGGGYSTELLARAVAPGGVDLFCQVSSVLNYRYLSAAKGPIWRPIYSMS
jgi:hypothetical protein